LWQWATPALSVALLGAIGWQLRDINISEAIPRSPAFWLVLLLYFFAPITAEFIIYRRLWGLPAEGFIALSRKQVGNTLLFDLLGEAYFYGWARKKLNMGTSPFGAVKDVTILSALVSSVCTLTFMALAWPFREQINIGDNVTMVAAAIGVMVLVSVLIIAFGKRLFSLSKGTLWWISGVHLLRVLAANGLLALAWSLYAPQIAFGTWALLATGKMMVSRLPFVGSQEWTFTALATFFLVEEGSVKQVIGVVTILILLIYLGAAAILAIGDLVTIKRAGKEVEG
jgi:hypothetical protein